MKQATLAQLQRWAETDARRLGLPYRVEVRWGLAPGGDGRGEPVAARCARGSELAHAHIAEAKRTGVARICARRGIGRETIHHEVAHFAPGGSTHGVTHERHQARLGSRGAKRRLMRAGKARCPRHRWMHTRVLSKDVRVRAGGLVEVTTYAAYCAVCEKRVG